MRFGQGFTLVEIAIVLIIVGLLIGGMLTGTEMITQAKIKHVIADFSGVTAAYHAYVDRYKKVPGDDPCAGAGAGLTLGNCGAVTPRWPAPATGGNGDGIVAGAHASGNPVDESRRWWDHLRRAGVVSGIGDLQPFNSVAGLIGVQTGDTAGGPVLGTDAAGTEGFAGLILCSTNLPAKIAAAADAQIDDGVPMSGVLRGQLQAAPNPPIGKQGAVAYAETGANVYTVCRRL
jgi:prepilin-type N-terminal cleavage/methylation domain-containing protein